MMRTSNPALSDKIFSARSTTDEKMTIQGTVNKSMILIGIVVAAAFYSWQTAYPSGWSSEAAPEIPQWYIFAIIGAVIMSFVIIFKPTTAPILAPAYAVLEGLTLGGLSAIFEYRFPGIVMQAVLCTFGTFFALLMAYKSKLIQVTANFRLGVVAATGGIALVYVLDFVFMLFGVRVPMLHENGMMGIGISIFVTVVAALNLVLDFDFIEKGADSGAPKYMEWYASFGLLITLVWLYLEILRLLSKSRRR